MRKKLFALLVGILAVTLLLTACAGVNLTLTFEVDGEAYATVTTSGQEAVQMPKDPVKEGYLFDGWYWDKDVWQKPFTANSLLETPLSENMTVYAKWKEHSTHNFGEWTVTTAATCTTEGLEKRLCECGEEETRVIEKLPHSFGEWTVETAATCTAEGSEKRVCECGEAETRVIEKLPHSFGEWTVETAATCTAEGTEKRVCECGEAETRVIEKLPHSFGEWTEEIPATCTAEGSEKRVCECGEAETRVTEKLPHSFGEWTVETAATCTAEGSEKRVCECGEAETRVIEKLSHTYEVKHDETNHWKECAVCHEEIDKAAHSFGEWTVVTAATCTTEGTKKRVCDVCKEEETRVIAIKAHDYITKYDETNHWSECSVCNDKKDEAAHTYENDVCTVCGSKYVTIGLSYSKSYDGYEVAGIGTVKESRIVIPSTYKGEPVISIGSEAFRGCSGLVSVVIPDSVTRIEYRAFEICHSLVSVEIPSSVTYIEGLAFAECTSLRSVAIPSSVTYIGSYAFGKCTSLESIVIPEGVTSIGSDAFKDCRSLVSIEIPNSVTSIGTYAFAYCSSLVSIEIPSGVTSIGSEAFYNCSSLTKVEISDIEAWCGIEFGSGDANPLYYAKHLYINGEEVTELVIPEGVTSIGRNAFNGCGSLETITVAEGNTKYHSAGNCLIETKTKTLILGCKNSIIPTDGSVTSIGNHAFYGCSGLKSIVIPDSVMSIDGNPFGRCSNLKTLTVAEGNTKYHSAGNCLIETETKTLILGCKNSIIPTDGSVTSIGDYAFYECRSLVSIVIPSGVTSIGYSAFEGCGSLTIYAEASAKPSGWDSNWNVVSWNVYCPVIWDYKNNDVADDGFIYTVQNGIRYGIKDGVATVVRQPSNIKTANIPSEIVYKDNTYRVTSIGTSAFRNCSSLESIEIPSGVTSIGYDAFSGCSSLVSVEIPSSVTSIGTSAFNGCYSVETITVAEGNTKYHSAGNCLIETKTKTLIAGCKNSIIPTDGSVTSIGYSAFSGCSSLISIEIPSSVTSIGDGAFSRTGIWNNTAENSVVYADKWAVGYKGEKSTEKNIVLRADTIGIGDSAFRYCNGLKSIVIPSGVTSIGDGAFSRTGIWNNTAENSVVYADKWAVGYKGEKSTVTNIVLRADTVGIGSAAFSYCESLVRLEIPKSVTSIGDRAFYGCISLVSVEIPNSVTIIGHDAFCYCDSLTIYAEASAKPSGWNSSWNYSNRPVIWDYKNNDVASDGFIYTVQNGIRYSLKDGAAMVVRQLRNITTANILSEIVYKDNTYSVTSIGDYAFEGCRSLVSIEIPNSVTSIGYGAFAYCSRLQSTVYGGTKAEWKAIAKGRNWNYNTGNYTVTCTDGTLSKAESML